VRRGWVGGGGRCSESKVEKSNPSALCNGIITGFSSRYLFATVSCMVKQSTVLIQSNDHILRIYWQSKYNHYSSNTLKMDKQGCPNCRQQTTSQQTVIFNYQYFKSWNARSCGVYNTHTYCIYIQPVHLKVIQNKIRLSQHCSVTHLPSSLPMVLGPKRESTLQSKVSQTWFRKLHTLM
jgi:hypothetical protein